MRVIAHDTHTHAYALTHSQTDVTDNQHRQTHTLTHVYTHTHTHTQTHVCSLLILTAKHKRNDI